ncbi:MAG: hypothetical protein KBD43_16090 [Saprospiraceae bacterium]|nr:hypothetical protein [Saprospiraceae bacterium]
MKNLFKLLGASTLFYLALIIVFPSNHVSATTASLFTSNNQVTVGQNFVVRVSIAPNNINFAEKIEIKFPPDILEAKSFTFANTWMALSQNDYDIVDNVNGILTKTAGYPSGVSSPTEFGTIVFQAKKAGSGTIVIGDKSLAFEANAQNQITGYPLSITINSNTPVVVVTQSSKISTPSISPTPQLTISTSTNSNLAQVQASNTNNFTIKIISLVLLLLLITLVYYYIVKNK